MKRQTLRSTFLLSLLSFLMISPTVALELNGIAAYEHLRKEYYIAALYSSAPSSDANTVINSTAAQRMVIKVTTKKWSPRRWALLWQDNIAINNDLDAHPELIKPIMRFTQFPKGNLSTGDEVIIDYSPAKGTRIQINRQTIVKAKGRTLFRYLLGTWVGKLPPAKSFKQRILKTHKDEAEQALTTRFANLYLPSTREQLVASWIQNEKAALRLAQEKKQAEAQKLAQQKAEKQQARLAVEKRKALEAEKKKQLAEQKRRDDIKKAQLAQARAKRETERKQAQALAAQKAASEKAKKAQSLSKEAYKLEQQYYQKLYQWELNRETLSRIVYPAWAKQFGQQGKVALNFTVNKDGALTNVKYNDTGVSQLLVKEVERALNESAQFVLPPVQLAGSQWAFEFSYEFSLGGNSRPIASKPQPPVSLRAKALSPKQIAQQKNNYIRDAIGSISHFIEYPESARVLQHKGKVALSITVDSSGNVIDIKEKTKSRHATLNEQLRKAVGLASPLPPLPDNLDQQTISFDVEHFYKR